MVRQGNQNHFVLASFPAQGHINPALHFAKRLVNIGVSVTFFTSASAKWCMLNNNTSYPEGLKFAIFSDGFDDGFKADENADHFMSEFRRRGSKALSGIVEAFANEGRPVTCLIFSILLPWASEVARKYKLSSAFLWNQPAAVFDIYYYYYSGYRDVILENIEDPSYSVKLPGLPLLKCQDLPSFLLPSNIYAFVQLFQEHFDLMSQETESFTVLVNTFDELEPEALKAVEKYNMIGIGPLIPSALLYGKDSSASFCGQRSKDYFEWLDSKDKASVVYISFGSMAVLTNKQMEELARGLVDSGRPFLWVIRSGGHGSKNQLKDKDENERYNEILREEHNGIVVTWCSQVEVLSHPSIGCFVTHCGWNSTLETLAMGVPVIAIPQWSDQGTNAKLIEDVWKMGVRVRLNEEDKIVTSREIIRCLKEVMEGERGKQLSNNSKKWKDLVRQAVKEGGSSERNLKTFVEEVGQNCG